MRLGKSSSRGSSAPALKESFNLCDTSNQQSSGDAFSDSWSIAPVNSQKSSYLVADGSIGRDSTYSDIARSVSIPRPDTHSGIAGSTGQRGGGTPFKNDALNRIWRVVLRECHRADRTQVGQISKNLFVAALQKADTAKKISQDDMNLLASTYTLANGRINYILCFRQCLGSLTQKSAASMSPSGGDSASVTSQITNLGKKTLAVDGLNFSNFQTNDNVDDRHTHPWEYSHPKREKYSEVPYWSNGASFPKERVEEGSPENMRGSMSSSSNAHTLQLDTSSSMEKQNLLRQFKPEVIGMLARTFRKVDKVWRPFRQALKKAQIPAQHSTVTVAYFVDALLFYGITIDKDDLGIIVRSFRGSGHGEVVIKYDEFLRACILLKGDGRGKK